MYYYYQNIHLLLLAAETISVKTDFKAAPPTKNPSRSGFLMSSAAFFSVTDPP